MNKYLLQIFTNTKNQRKILSKIFLLLAVMLTSYSLEAQTFPCGTQDINVCSCDGSGALIADSEPCSFNSGQLQEYVLVDVADASVSTDLDDGSIVAVTDNGVFNSIPSGDYIIYNIFFNPVDAPFFNGQLQEGNSLDLLLQLGTEGPAGVWTSDVPNFIMIASDLASVNGPECSCSEIDISDPCDCSKAENYVENGTSYVYEVVSIASSPNQTWTLDLNDSAGMYDASANPLMGGLTATEVSPGEYEFTFFFIPGIGYTANFENESNQELSISALGADCVCDLEECESLTECPPMDFCTGEQETILICPDFCLDGSFDYKELKTLYHCSVVPTGDGNCFEYTPLPGMEFIGTDLIELLAVNENGECIEQNINIVVGGCNNPPLAVDDYYESDGSSVTITPTLNDSDTDGDFIYVCGYYSDPANGTLTLTNGTFIYTPNDGFTGVDSFDYTICDGNGAQSVATVYIETSSVPTCENDNLSLCTGYMTPLYLCPDFCMFEDGEEYMISSSFSTYSCALYVMDEKCIRYTPIPGFYGDDYIQIVACSTQPGHSMWCDTVYAQIQVKEDCNEIVDPVEPCSADMQTCTAAMTPIELCVPFCTPDVSIVRAQTTYNCSISLIGENCVRYIPVPGFLGTGHIEIEACDNQGNCEIAMITVDVTDDCASNGGRLPDDSICDIELPESFVPYAFGNDGRMVVDDLNECYDNATVKFTVYSVSGQLVHSASVSDGNTLWDANQHNWSSGMYVYSLDIESDDKVERKTGYINLVR